MKWIIVDWTNTRCYSNKKFKSYEDAWEFLYSEYPAVDGDFLLFKLVKLSTYMTRIFI